jgi:hypothetical protein
MTSWLVKALVQRGIGALPNPHYWNELLQKRVTRSLDLTDEHFYKALRYCRRHVEQLRRFGATAADGSFSAFELGTGWFPVVAIGFFLSGAREVWTWDITPLLRRDRLQRTIGRFLELEQRQGLGSRLQVLPERLARLREVMALCDSSAAFGPGELLERLSIRYRIGNASRSGLAPLAVDLIVSDSVLEYVSPEALLELLQEWRRIAAPHAVMSHTITLADQYVNFDPGITPFNFLRFSDRTWRWLSNPIIPLNRLRVSDYRRGFSESGFQIVDEVSRRGHPGELARTPLAARFCEYPIEDLLVIHTSLVAVPA